MSFDLLSFLEGVAGGIFLAIILKIISKIRNRKKSFIPTPVSEPLYPYPHHPNPPFDAPQGITPKPIFENNGEGGSVKRFIRG